MNFRLGAVLLVFFLVIGCKTESNSKKGPILSPELDSIEKVNMQSIIDAGKQITKAYLDSQTKEIELWADMKKDHRFYGYEKPDTASKRLILFSIFTNDVEGNPFELPLGSYYDTHGLETSKVMYVSGANDFVKAEIVSDRGSKTTVYFEKKWIVLEEEEYTEDDEYDTNDDTITEYGKVVKFEDGVYPQYIVTIDFVERNFTQDFNLNIEAVSIDGETLNNLPGKYVTIDYTSELIDDLNDIHFNGKSLYGQYAPEMDSSWKTITGILSGAASLSGDLPNLVTITEANGNQMNFELYVDDEVMKANEKEVTVYHSVRAINTIVDIKTSLD